MGMAAIGIALYKYVMKYSPKNCNYFNRDRFVLSNGTSLGLPSAKSTLETNDMWLKESCNRPCMPMAVSLHAPCGN